MYNDFVIYKDKHIMNAKNREDLIDYITAMTNNM